MKKCILAVIYFLCFEFVIHAQVYPEPAFSKEVSFLKKNNSTTSVRLEKTSSKVETKTKFGGFGGFEYGYVIEGIKSPVRLLPGNLVFIYTTLSTARSSSLQTDSIMRAHGVDPAKVAGMSASTNDPSSLITLYKVENEKDERKILIQKSGGAIPFASKKAKPSDKYTFSVQKIKEGYWELVVDKPLEKGEYAFTINQSMGSMDGGITIFAFGID
ncbi:MAG: hypothetical protein ABI472_17845 [Ginsengibacter sp.]